MAIPRLRPHPVLYVIIAAGYRSVRSSISHDGAHALAVGAIGPLHFLAHRDVDQRSAFSGAHRTMVAGPA